ncbi:5-guanidino-2-oxopentanoate decarboxylase [Paracoccus homiensis]|uniref:Acetolactate synthase-1/2/3 large subunit n=1 Tax=Paracoccus homiensis TaxID=364199 RepID=A0A1I0J9K5_9RHOB|nr:5-guanidino-2-oxopentanoate decarboxylase [Paracoccus homiensis]SEU06673.1 acetolactate synthase-1/2/3 large subunit [Paracoccus homiensis]
MTAPVPGRAGPWIHALLKSYGVSTVFGIPGVHTIPLYDGLVESGLTHVTPRHEQGAGFMADGYARQTGKPGVCFVITGPGVTNIATAMGQAYAESVPMLVISSVNRRRHMGLGQGQLHELADQRAVMRNVAAFSHTLHSLADLPKVLARAFAVFGGARPRPVHIEIPLDLWDELPPPDQPRAPFVPALGTAAPAATRAAVRALADAGRPVILAGGGARYAAADLQRLAERLDAPVVMTTNARGILPPDHPLAVPFSPSLDSVRALIADSDAVLAIGTEIGPTDYDMYETGMPDLPSPLIRVEIDPVQMVTNAIPDLPLPGDAAVIAADLLGRLTQGHARNGAQRAATTRRAAFAGLDARMQAGLAVLAMLRDAGPDVPIVGDSTHPVYAGNLGHAAARPGTWFNSATGFGTLGYALPAAIGAALGRDGPVFCLVGDGGLHYALGEMASLIDSAAPVILLVWNNARYGEIHDAMVAAGVTPEGVHLASPDFVLLAGSYGIPACRAATCSDLAAAVTGALARNAPFLVDIDEAAILAELCDGPALAETV